MSKMSTEKITFIEKNYEVLQKEFANSLVTVRYRSPKHVLDNGCDNDALVVFGAEGTGKYVGICFEARKHEFKLWFPNDDVARKFGLSSCQESIYFEGMTECANKIKDVLGI